MLKIQRYFSHFKAFSCIIHKSGNSSSFEVSNIPSHPAKCPSEVVDTSPLPLQVPTHKKQAIDKDSLCLSILLVGLLLTPSSNMKILSLNC